MTDPKPKTATGHPEQRHRLDRRARARRQAEKNLEPITRGEFDRRGRRDRRLFVALALISCAAAFLGYKAGQDSQNGLTRAGARATYDTCQSGGELRIAVAKGLDDLRSLAITGPRVPAKVRARFVAQTQPAIDRLLTQAAGRRYRAPLPPGAVTSAVVREVRALSIVRCIDRAGRTFDAVPDRG